jgi:alcohol dehydrogenase/propanol-preferring alcohol dehydrogenase
MPLPPDEPVLLIGAGGLGLAAISMLKSFGHSNIVSADISEDKLAAASAAGATRTVNTSGPDASTLILEATGGPVIAVIDFVNSSATAAMVNGLVAKGAKWVQVGVMGGSIEFSLVANIFRGLTIFSNITGNIEHLKTVTELAKEGKLSPIPVQEMPWDSVNEAMDLLRQGKAVGRIVLVK